MNKQQTLEHFYDASPSFGDMLLSVLTILPGTTIIGMAASMNVILTNAQKKEIKEAGYFSKIMTIEWGGGTERGTYAYAWDTHPTCTIYNATKVKSVKYGR